MRTPNNWGKMGDTPSNPELLDYLARRFVESGWSVKSLHRMILLSNTYQMSAEPAAEARELDPANRLNSRFNRLRMSVEEVRDSMLALAGTMDSTIGGALPRTKGKKLELDDLKRRTLYIPVRRGSVPALLSNFDFGDATTSGEGRARTNVAPQALFVMNSRFVAERSKDFARRLLEDPALTDRQRVERAWMMALTRQPGADEVDSALSYVVSLERKLSNGGGACGCVAEPVPCAGIDERVPVFAVTGERARPAPEMKPCRVVAVRANRRSFFATSEQGNAPPYNQDIST